MRNEHGFAPDDSRMYPKPERKRKPRSDKMQPAKTIKPATPTTQKDHDQSEITKAFEAWRTLNFYG